MLLEQEGIPVEIRRDSLSPLSGSLPHGDALIEIFVPAADAARASRILKEANDDNGRFRSRPKRCPECGEENEPDYDICWNCQADLPQGILRQESRSAPPIDPIPGNEYRTGFQPDPLSEGRYEIMKNLLIALLLIATIGLGVLSLNLYSENRTLLGNALTHSVWDEDGLCLRSSWRDSNTLESVYCDENSNGVYEIITDYHFSGKKIAELNDRNENGIFERIREYNLEGVLVAEYFDRDEDRRSEEIRFYYPDGWIKYYDKDGDSIHELREHYNRKGELTGRFKEGGPFGLRRVR